MAHRQPEKHLSRLERQRFDVLAECSTVKQAAGKLGLKEGTMNNWTYKLRNRLEKERGHLNACLAQQKRSSLLKEILSKKKPIQAAEEEDERTLLGSLHQEF